MLGFYAFRLGILRGDVRFDFPLIRVVARQGGIDPREYIPLSLNLR